MDGYAVGFYFEVTFNQEDSAFQEVSGITKEMHIEDVVSGGENRFKYRLPTRVTSPNLVLKRALIPKTSKLIKWCIDTLDAGLANPVSTQDLNVRLLNPGGVVAQQWLFHETYPVKYGISEFRSDENKLVIESIELAYTYFEIPN